jgi:hypothetical protein
LNWPSIVIASRLLSPFDVSEEKRAGGSGSGEVRRVLAFLAGGPPYRHVCIRLVTGAGCDLHAGAATFAMTIMGVVGGILGFVLGLPIGLAAAYLVYLRFFAPRRRLQVTTLNHPSPPEIKLEIIISECFDSDRRINFLVSRTDIVHA